MCCMMYLLSNDFVRKYSAQDGLSQVLRESLLKKTNCWHPSRTQIKMSCCFRLHANLRNIVDQQLPTLLDVTCCVRLHILLHVVGCCCVLSPAKFETSQTFQLTTPNISFVPWSPKRSATMLDSFAQLFQHCWSHARSLRIVYKDLWVVSFPRCTAGPKLVGSCCIRLMQPKVHEPRLINIFVPGEDTWLVLRR